MKTLPPEMIGDEYVEVPSFAFQTTFAPFSRSHSSGSRPFATLFRCELRPHCGQSLSLSVGRALLPVSSEELLSERLSVGFSGGVRRPAPSAPAIVSNTSDNN